MHRPLAAATIVSAFLVACAGQPRPANLDVAQVSDASSPIIQAAAAGNTERVRVLSEGDAALNTRSPETTTLTAAAAGGHGETVWYLLKRGANPDLASLSGRTPLMVAAREGNQEVIRMLLSAGAEVNRQAQNGHSPLSMAALNGNLSTAKRLLTAGANVNIAPGGRSLLMHVIERGDLLMAEALIAAGANTEYQAADGQTALDVARQVNNRDLEMLLIQAGAR
ncbi:ankyrin repeat protein [Tamilnaduibacter salinus]|uniref:Ankyrin repeat protein n=1 Tax=Tamilnaduibacter salinus TaxID=1484056 RepID=A0A2U1CWB6_9GAMM|nr:ankyrin repeat domain-containing protein [Tamilnaduibacter salinus]PVY76292.1 ankyrin repeat protein [Tamilnaduibacter salinus]